MPLVRDVGERALLVETDAPAAAAAWIRRRMVAGSTGLLAGITGATGGGTALTGVVDVVPAAHTVLVTLAAAGHLAAVRAVLEQLPGDLSDTAVAGAPVVRLPVRFDGADLAAVAAAAGTEPATVARLVLATEFTVAFCGFAPGFAYLSGLPPVLHLPRRAEPRARVPAGALAVADRWAAVYPRPGPGGWHLIGSMVPGADALFDVERDPPALLTAGTVVRFEAAQ